MFPVIFFGSMNYSRIKKTKERNCDLKLLKVNKEVSFSEKLLILLVIV